MTGSAYQLGIAKSLLEQALADWDLTDTPATTAITAAREWLAAHPVPQIADDARLCSAGIDGTPEGPRNRPSGESVHDAAPGLAPVRSVDPTGPASPTAGPVTDRPREVVARLAPTSRGQHPKPAA